MFFCIFLLGVSKISLPNPPVRVVMSIRLLALSARLVKLIDMLGI